MYPGPFLYSNFLNETSIYSRLLYIYSVYVTSPFLPHGPFYLATMPDLYYMPEPALETQPMWTLCVIAECKRLHMSLCLPKFPEV